MPQAKRKPYDKAHGRKYSGPDGDYAKFQASPAQKKERAKRNANRAEAEKEGRVHKGDGKDIHHKGNKTKVMSASKNRGIKEKSRLKGSRRS